MNKCKTIVVAVALLMGAVLPSAAAGRAKQVIAHRGYWKTEGSAQNSISSLNNSYSIGVYGSEFDVHITRDGEVVVFHDDDIDGIKIENAQYADISVKRLAKGERFVTPHRVRQAKRRKPSFQIAPCQYFSNVQKCQRKICSQYIF